VGSQSDAIIIASVIRATCSFDAKISSASTKVFELIPCSKSSKKFSQFSDFTLQLSALLIEMPRPEACRSISGIIAATPTQHHKKNCCSLSLDKCCVLCHLQGPLWASRGDLNRYMLDWFAVKLLAMTLNLTNLHIWRIINIDSAYLRARQKRRWTE